MAAPPDPDARRLRRRLALRRVTPVGGAARTVAARHGADASLWSAAATPLAVTTVSWAHTTGTLVSAAATFLQQDTTTSGSWVGVYGHDGTEIQAYTFYPPSYVSSITFGNNVGSATWEAGGTTSTYAPQNPTNPTAIRNSSCWFCGPTVDVSVDTDGRQYHLALYFLDLNSTPNRVETVQFTDLASGQVLDTRTVSAFTNGTYLQWAVRGNVHIAITLTAGINNAVVTGFFFDPAPVPATRTHTADTATAATTATPIGPGYRGLFGLWFGGAGLASLAKVPHHGTGSMVVTAGGVFHATDTRAKLPVALVHRTDALRRGTYAWLHYTDTIALKPTIVVHGADARTLGTIAWAHSADSWLVQVGVYTRPHTSNAAVSGHVYLGHATDTRAVTRPTRSHAGDALCRITPFVYHNMDAWATWTRTPVHSVDAQLAPKPIVTSTRTHGADAGLRGPRTPAHGTGSLLHATRWRGQRIDAYLVEPGFVTVIQAHTTDALIEGVLTATRFHHADALGLLSSAYAHTADALVLLAAAWTHIADAWAQGPETWAHGADALSLLTAARTHSADALALATQAAAHATDARVVAAGMVAGTTDALALGSPTPAHQADARLRLTAARGHTTDSEQHGMEARGHFTDVILLGSRWTVTYTDTLRWRADTLAHATDATPCHAYYASHTTGALIGTSKAEIHRGDAAAAMPRSTAHAADVRTQKTPMAGHGTSSVSVRTRAVIHSADALAYRPPPVGRWAAPRVGTRTAAGIASHDRQQGTLLYPVGFLLVSHDRITPVLGATPAVQLRKPGATGWVPAYGVVTEVGDGWYQLAGHPNDRTVAGEYVLMATSPKGETTFAKFDVVVPDPYAPVALSPAERNAAADVMLGRFFGSVASIPARCMLQAIRALWSWKTVQSGPMSVLADDGTTAWQANVIDDPTIGPIRGMDPM
jgi:hypothetical protein